MAILEKEVLVGLAANNAKYFEGLGYGIPRKINKYGNTTIPQGTKILVKIEDLPKKSGIKLTKVCDECGKYIPNQSYQNISEARDSYDGKDRCFKCTQIIRGLNRKQNVEKSLEYFAYKNKKIHLLNEFSNKNERNLNEYSYGSEEIILWNCHICKNEYDMPIKDKTSNSYNCPYCSGHRLLVGFNDLWTTHPSVAKLLVNPERGYEISKGYNGKEDFICNECGYLIKNKLIPNVVKRGLSCPRCSDGIKYPEKFMINVLDQLKIEYEFQKTFEWSKDIKHKNKKISGLKRYDFYIPSLNCIIETHGMQHYKEKTGYFDSKTVEEEQENDRIKKKYAKENVIKTYIIIDCSISELKYIKSNIISSEISILFNLDRVDWQKCHEFACNSLIKSACNLWNQGVSNTTQIGKILNLSEITIKRYLKKGSELDWCKYKPKKIHSFNEMRKKKIVQLSLENIFIKNWNCITEAYRILQINNISTVCNGYRKTAGGYKWMYKEDYDQYIKQAK